MYTNFIDNFLNSIHFRILYVLYALLICLCFENYFNSIFYFFVIVSYIVFYFLFFLRRLAFLRLLNDAIFIGLIILAKPIENIVIGSFLFLGIINVPNHTGKKKPRYYYLFLLSVILLHKLHSYYFLNVQSYQLEAILPFLAFVTFSEIIINKNELGRKIQSLHIELDNIYGEKFGYKTYKVYRELISLFRENRNHVFEDMFNLEKVLCFRVIKGSQLRIVNSSDFVWEYRIEEKDELIENNGKILIKNIPIRIENKVFDSNFWIKINIDEAKYLFCFIGKWKLTSLYYSLFSGDVIKKSLPPLLNKIARIHEAERIVNELKRKNVQAFMNKGKYVYGAIDAMHFVRNKLTPIVNYFALVKNHKLSINADFEIDSDIDQLIAIEEIIQNEEKKARKVCHSISKKADNILDKKINPFNPSNIKKIDPRSIFANIRLIWNDLNLKETFNLNWDIVSIRPKILVDSEVLEIVFIDIITNLQKYNNGQYYVNFDDFKDFYEITFTNNVNEYDFRKVEKICKDFMSTNSNSLVETNGLQIVRSNLKQMNIPYNVYICDQGLYNFKLIFKKPNSYESTII